MFLEDAHHSGMLSNPEYALMKRWYEFSVDKFHKQVEPDLIGNNKLDYPILYYLYAFNYHYHRTMEETLHLSDPLK